MELFKLYQFQLDGIHAKLKAWKEQNEISLEMSQKGVIANLLEELTEHRRASTSNDEIAMCDAKCDLIVFAMNAMNALPLFDLKQNGAIYGCIDLRNLQPFEASIALHIYYLLKMEQDKVFYKKSITTELCSIIARCINELHHTGFDVMKAMDETVKQISSRSGKMNYEIGKWQKDKSPEAQAREYKADYESCRIK